MTDASPPADAPLAVQDLANACVRFVERAVGIALDYTPETLPILDHYLHSVRPTSREEFTNLVAPAAGAYFGEVVRRHLGPAQWHWEPDEMAACRLEFERCFLSFNPIGSALEAVLGAAAEGYGAHLSLLREDEEAVDAALERMGTVREEDFYRLALRYEALEQAVALLVERVIMGRKPMQVFGADVYAALRQGTGSGLVH